MSVLSSDDIWHELNYGELEVSPIDQDAQIQPNSLDVRLGEEFDLFTDNASHIDPKEGIKPEHYNKYRGAESFMLYPTDFVLATTEESFKIPNYLEGELMGRSSIGRLGVEVHSTAGLVDAGYEGEITLEITNNNVVPVKLYSGMRIAQVVFKELKTRSSDPYSEQKNKYQGQEGVTHSRLDEEL